MAAVKTVRPLVELAEDVQVLLSLLTGEGVSAEDCATVRVDVLRLSAEAEDALPRKQGESRHPAVRAVAAAGVHLGRAGDGVPVELARRLACQDLADAGDRLSALAGGPVAS